MSISSHIQLNMKMPAKGQYKIRCSVYDNAYKTRAIYVSINVLHTTSNCKSRSYAYLYSSIQVTHPTDFIYSVLSALSSAFPGNRQPNAFHKHPVNKKKFPPIHIFTLAYQFSSSAHSTLPSLEFYIKCLILNFDSSVTDICYKLI